MAIRMIGSISEYTRSLKLSARWQMKKDNRTYTEKSSLVSDEFEMYREQLEKAREDSNPTKAAIYQKLACGNELTAEEEAYLKEHDMMAYQKYKELRTEQENYERELKKCKTKEDVERLQTVHLGTRFAAANSIANNPNIPKAQKMGLLMQENAKAKAIAEATRKFKDSLTYDRLPTDEEKRQEEEEKLEELQGENEVGKDTPAEEEEKDEIDETLPEEGAENADSDRDLVGKGENSAERADIWTEAQTGANTAVYSYGRQAYQREAAAAPNQELIFKRKRG